MIQKAMMEHPMPSENPTDCEGVIGSHGPPSDDVLLSSSKTGLLNGNQDQSCDPTRNKKHPRSSKVFFRSGDRTLRLTTRVDIAFKITLVLCVLMTLATLAITINIAIGTRGQGSQGMSELSGHSDVCFDNVGDSWSSPETDPMFEKLEKRTVNGARQVCAKNLEQLGVITELAMTMRNVKSEMYLAQQTRYTVTPVSAHKLLQSPDQEINITEPAISDYPTVAWLKSNTTNSPIEHANGVTVTNGSLLIQQPGLYYVYFGVHFQPVSDRPAKEFKYKKWIWYVCRTRSVTSKRKALLLQVAHTACDNCRNNTKTSFAGGSFYLEAGDYIKVAYAFLGVVKYNTESSFLGLMMLDS